MRSLDQKKIYRVIDANYNRLKEGLRVCEDVCRFILDDRRASAEYKNIRHQITLIVKALRIFKVIDARNIENDVGKKSIKVELKRAKVSDIFYANSQRVKESIRVLEEFSKLVNQNSAVAFKSIRYKIYALEQKIIKKL